jgi:hypothetical protein
MPSGGRLSPLVKQLGGIALGVAVACALAAAHMNSMKQAGKSLDQAFVERAVPGNPEAAIEQVGGGDALLKNVHRVCIARAARADLTELQRIATDPVSILQTGERRLARAAAYVACLMNEQPQRFCQKPQQQHLFEAMRQYLKLATQIQVEWKLQAVGPAAMVTPPWRPEQLAAIDMPSTRLDPQIVEGLVALDASGYLPASEFARFDGLGLSLGGSQASAQTRKAACG